MSAGVPSSEVLTRAKISLQMGLTHMPSKLVLNVGRELHCISPQDMCVLMTWQLAPPGQMIQEGARWKLQCLLQPSFKRSTLSISQYPVDYTSQLRRELHKGMNTRLKNHGGGAFCRPPITKV
jgi:hypothetical protein